MNTCNEVLLFCLVVLCHVIHDIQKTLQICRTVCPAICLIRVLNVVYDLSDPALDIPYLCYGHKIFSLSGSRTAHCISMMIRVSFSICCCHSMVSAAVLGIAMVSSLTDVRRAAAKLR